MRPSLAALLPLFLLTACPVEPPRAFPLEFVAKEGSDAALRPLEAGEVVELHSGFQGGQHLFVSLRGQDVDEGPALITLRLEDPGSGAELTRKVELRQSFDSVPEGGLVLSDLLMMVDQPDGIVGRTVRLEAFVESEDDHAEAEAAQTITVQWAGEAP